MSKVGSYNSSPFHVLSHSGNIWSSLLTKGESPATRAFSCVMCDLAEMIKEVSGRPECSSKHHSLNFRVSGCLCSFKGTL